MRPLLRTLRHQRAFTLAELMITITLLALVASSVIAFVSAMSSFSVRNIETVDRLDADFALRQELDNWFAVLDHPDWEIEVLSDGETVTRTLVRALGPDGSLTYSVRYGYGEEAGQILFTYPETVSSSLLSGSRTTAIDAEGVSISFLVFGDVREGWGEEGYVFPILTHVHPNRYLCQIIHT